MLLYTHNKRNSTLAKITKGYLKSKQSNTGLQHQFYNPMIKRKLFCPQYDYFPWVSHSSLWDIFFQVHYRGVRVATSVQCPLFLVLALLWIFLFCAYCTYISNVFCNSSLRIYPAHFNYFYPIWNCFFSIHHHFHMHPIFCVFSKSSKTNVWCSADFGCGLLL